MAIVVDDDINPTDPIAVEYAVATRCQADRDFIVIANAKDLVQTHQVTRTITHNEGGHRRDCHYTEVKREV